jgi:hypothetical protein
MQKLDAAVIIELAKEIGRVIEVQKDLSADDIPGPGSRANNIRVMKNHSKTFEDLGLVFCKAHTDRIVQELSKEIAAKDFAVLLNELYNRLIDEFNALHFISLTKAETEYYQPSDPLFGREVEDKLAKVIEDISEAGKCLGLRRSTAAVFHLMRIMEVGVQALGTKLGVTLANEKMWQVILDQINVKVKALGNDPMAKEYAAISAHLYNVKLAWRNETMHPKATYTAEEAEGIFASVRAFMKELIGVL